MNDMRIIEHLFSSEVLLLLGLMSGVFFVGTLIAIPIVLVRLPHDYFDDRHSRVWLHNYHPAIRITGYVIKNVIGVVFLLAGIAMIVLPGQGVLTILIGVSLMDFPGKRKLERKLMGRPAVLRTINMIREKFGRPPLDVPKDDDS